MTGASPGTDAHLDAGAASPAHTGPACLWQSFTTRTFGLLRTRVFVAMSWTALGLGITQILRLAGTLIMTRLLAPEMFGVMSIVVALYVTIAMLSDIGLRMAIIQSPKGDDPEFLNTAWTVQIIRATGIAMLIVLSGGLLAQLQAVQGLPESSVWAVPELPVILMVFAATPFISGFESTNLITANRNLQLKRVVLIQLGSQIGGLAAMIVLGILTKSIWALVASNMVSALLLTILSHTALPGIRNRPVWNRDALGELSRYGSWILLASTAFVLATNVDKFILGGLSDASTLGLYAIALNLVMLVDNLGMSLLGAVALPALSETARNDPERFRSKYLRFRLPLDTAFVAASGGLFVLGPVIVQILYDDRYLAAGPMLQILALSLLFSRFNFAGTAYMALGLPKRWAILSCIKLVSFTALLIALFGAYGFIGALYAVALHMILVLPFIYWFNRDLKLNDLRFELAVLLAWPVGYVLGLLALAILQAIVS